MPRARSYVRILFPRERTRLGSRPLAGTCTWSQSRPLKPDAVDAAVAAAVAVEAADVVEKRPPTSRCLRRRLATGRWAGARTRVTAPVAVVVVAADAAAAR